MLIIVTICNPPRTTTAVYVPSSGSSDLEIRVLYQEEAEANENSDNNNKKPPGKVDNTTYYKSDPYAYVHGIC